MLVSPLNLISISSESDALELRAKSLITRPEYVPGITEKVNPPEPQVTVIVPPVVQVVPLVKTALPSRVTAPLLPDPQAPEAVPAVTFPDETTHCMQSPFVGVAVGVVTTMASALPCDACRLLLLVS